MQQAAGTNAVAGSVKAVTFGGHSKRMIHQGTELWSDWIDIEISRDKNYLVRFQSHIDNTNTFGGAASWTYPAASPPMSYIDGQPDDRIVFLKEIEVTYPKFGLYRSGVFDTRQPNPSYRQINWTQVEPFPAADIDIRVRTANQSDMSDATAWSPLGYFQNNTGNHINHLAGRYVQYEALFESASPYTRTAKMRDVTINWAGVPGLVDLVVGFARGPDYGIVTAEVNGQPFIKGVEVEMEIFKAGPFGTNSVAGLMEVRPLNTGR